MFKSLSPHKIIILGFILLIIIGTFVLSLPISKSTKQFEKSDIVNSIFTATSAICVTGLTVVDVPNYFSLFGQLIVMILIQIGGLGYMILSTFFIIFTGKRMSIKSKIAIQESLAFSKFSGVINFVKYVLKLTVIIEVIGAILLFFVFNKNFNVIKSIYFAIFHSISAFNNAGFALFSDNLIRYHSNILLNVTIMSLIVIGGIGYIVLLDVWNLKEKFKLSLHSKIVITVTLMLIIVGFVFILSLEYKNAGTISNFSMKDKIMASLFQTITPRTAGFNTIDIGALRASTLFIIMLLMFIGASPGGTGGGIKTVTFFVLMQLVWKALRHEKDINVFKRKIDESIGKKSVVIFFISILFISIIFFALLAIEKFTFEKLLFEVISAFGTVGLSTGITPFLTDISKILLCLMMFIGRIGPLTLGYALFIEKEYVSFQYPVEDIQVG